MKKIVLIPFFILLISSQCAPVKTQSEDEKFDKTFNLNKGEEFVIKLKANPSTGYNWSIKNEVKESVVTLMSESYKPDKVPENKDIVGSGGTKIYVFKAEGKGQTVVRMVYKRQGMPEPEEEKAFLIKVR